MSSPTPFVVGWVRAAPTNTQTGPGGVWVRLVVKTTWSPTAGLTALHQSRGTARTCASTVLLCYSLTILGNATFCITEAQHVNVSHVRLWPQSCMLSFGGSIMLTLYRTLYQKSWEGRLRLMHTSTQEQFLTLLRSTVIR